MNKVQGFQKYLYYDIILASNNSAYPPPWSAKKKKRNEKSVDCRPEKVKIRGKKKERREIWLRLLDFDGNDGKCHDGRRKEKGGKGSVEL